MELKGACEGQTEKTCHRIDRNQLSERIYILRYILRIFLSTTLLPFSCSPKNSYDFEGNMTTVSLVLFQMSIFSPIPLYIHWVQGSGRDDQRTCAYSGVAGLMLGRSWGRSHQRNGSGGMMSSQQREQVEGGRRTGGGVWMSCTQPSRSSFLQGLLIPWWPRGLCEHLHLAIVLEGQACSGTLLPFSILPCRRKCLCAL